jgi:hypothetical protein
VENLEKLCNTSSQKTYQLPTGKIRKEFQQEKKKEIKRRR